MDLLWCDIICLACLLTGFARSLDLFDLLLRLLLSFLLFWVPSFWLVLPELLLLRRWRLIHSYISFRAECLRHHHIIILF